VDPNFARGPELLRWRAVLTVVAVGYSIDLGGLASGVPLASGAADRGERSKFELPPISQVFVLEWIR
jgi:hypothetical protein